MSGSSGNGGTITVTYDPQAKPFLAILKLSNLGWPAAGIQRTTSSSPVVSRMHAHGMKNFHGPPVSLALVTGSHFSDSAPGNHTFS